MTEAEKILAGPNGASKEHPGSPAERMLRDDPSAVMDFSMTANPRDDDHRPASNARIWLRVLAVVVFAALVLLGTYVQMRVGALFGYMIGALAFIAGGRLWYAGRN